MKRTGLTVALLVAAFSVISTPALATGMDPQTVVVPKDRAAIAEFKEAMTEYKADLAIFSQAKNDYKAQKVAYKDALASFKPVMAAYRAAKKQIAQTFSSTVRAAKAAFVSASGDEASLDEKLAAKSEFKQIKAEALENRNSAISALGPAPAKPTAPVKPSKPTKPVRPA